ncbi:MAG: signal peptidase II, partial [Massilioclostridium sp.]
MKKIIFGVVTVFLVVLDQLFKFLVAQWLPMENDTTTIIPGVLNFTHIEN